MAKRSRDEASCAPPPPPQPEAKRRREPAAAAFPRCNSVETRGLSSEPAAESVAGEPAIATDVRVVVGGSSSAASAGVELPRWWQLWVGRGGGAVVDCEELLWGWFPFVDEDFAADGEKAGWLSIWGDELQDAPHGGDIWAQLERVTQFPARSA